VCWVFGLEAVVELQPEYVVRVRESIYQCLNMCVYIHMCVCVYVYAYVCVCVGKYAYDKTGV
jgi:hypothetical protein